MVNAPKSAEDEGAPPEMRWKRTRRANKDGGDEEEGDEDEGGMRQGRDFFKGEGEREAGMDGRDPREPENSPAAAAEDEA